ncbi:MAG: HlyC/CorC family transporter [Opitutales bacterium]|nr:HlyC/CorC family transporter [Opitutales bacterium]
MACFFLTVFLTLAISAFCSLLEAMVLSTKQSEIEQLKKISRRRGEMLDTFVREIDRTSSAILSLNTIANTFGATLSGVLFATCMSKYFPSDFHARYTFPAVLTIAILTFSEIFPKNIGVYYRPALQPYFVYPLYWVRVLMSPFSVFMSKLLAFITRGRDSQNSSDDEIKLLAEKGAKDGLITVQEKELISNTLTLDDTSISEIMTPRTVVAALDEARTVEEVLASGDAIPFARLPVYRDTIDNITGIVRSRDLLLAKANDEYSRRVGEFVKEAAFVPENGSSLSVMRQLIKKHQHIGIVVDEYGSLTGVVTLEDIFEHLLGSEIFEPDDVAVDMRELALRRKKIKSKTQK